jgi:hypothetical protein
VEDESAGSAQAKYSPDTHFYLAMVILPLSVAGNYNSFVNLGRPHIVLLGAFIFFQRAAYPGLGPSSASTVEIRTIILRSRHMGAHGMGYSDRSLSELARKLSPADVPILIGLLTDRTVRVGVQFALASQCEASILPIREAANERRMDFLDASDVMDLISDFGGCAPMAREKAHAMRNEIDQMRQENEARIAEEAKRKAANDARIQENSIKMIDPQRSKALTREEREEVYHRSLKAMGLDEKGPLTPAQKQMVERMYRTMVLGQTNGPATQ